LRILPLSIAGGQSGPDRRVSTEALLARFGQEDDLVDSRRPAGRLQACGGTGRDRQHPQSIIQTLMASLTTRHETIA
jgi:hypothetical protein